MRKLASIQIISNIEPIPNANVIRVASVLGWKSVIKEGQFNIGDKCVFVEIDSVLPDKPEFADFLKKGNRLKSIRLKGQLSQGVCLPLSILPSGEYNAGDDVTGVLGITKYDPPMPANISGNKKGLFPSFVPKTDEPRVQICGDILERYRGKSFYVSEKLDGCSVTYFKYNNIFGACSRNYELKEDKNNTIWKMAYKYDLQENLANNYAIQCELIGEGIQSNPLKIKGQNIYIFGLFDIEKQRYCSLGIMENIALSLDLKTVPILEDDFILNHSLDDLIKLGDGYSGINQFLEREGLVFRLHDNSNGKVSFKCISNKYLLKS